MGDYGNVGINAGYARLNARDYGKIGLEGSLKKELDKNPNIGYTLGGNASALIAKKQVLMPEFMQEWILGHQPARN